MAVTRTPKFKKINRSDYSSFSEGKVTEGGAQLTLIKGRPKLDKLLRSRCRLAFIVISLLAMLVVIRSGISASRGYALVETQNMAQQIEQENERLKIEIAKMKSPQRIKQIAEDELGMGVPNKMYFSH
ncbi:MAG: cell division protein FtsL [Selenomonadaceae bacterium]|nr:cell division protein FtsL [Selenomonadaceae bacterium]